MKKGSDGEVALSGPGPSSGASTAGDAWSRDPKAPSGDSYGRAGNKRNRRHSTNVSSPSDSSGQQRPPMRTGLPGNSRDDLSLISVSNGSDMRSSVSREMLTTPQGAGLYPPRNRYNVRLPPLTKRQY